ncbi:MAG: hypothetical protein ABFD91_11555 [Anaerohalosphaeraceae bacterium]
MHKTRGFAAILGLLIVIAIAMMLYFMDLSAIFGPSRQYMDRPTTPEDNPWRMEDLLVGLDKNVPSPRKGQPELLEPLQLTASVQRNDAPRGQVNLSFGKDCRVAADWAAQYEFNKKTYSIESHLSGNIVPSKVYSDANGSTDKTRLFFIAKGPYSQTTRLPDKTVQSEQGTAYLLGWLSNDNTATGTITITTDQSWSAQYPFITASSNTSVQ